MINNVVKYYKLEKEEVDRLVSEFKGLAQFWDQSNAPTKSTAKGKT